MVSVAKFIRAVPAYPSILLTSEELWGNSSTSPNPSAIETVTEMLNAVHLTATVWKGSSNVWRVESPDMVDSPHTIVPQALCNFINAEMVHAKCEKKSGAKISISQVNYISVVTEGTFNPFNSLTVVVEENKTTRKATINIGGLSNSPS